MCIYIWSMVFWLNVGEWYRRDFGYKAFGKRFTSRLKKKKRKKVCFLSGLNVVIQGCEA